MEMNVMGDCCVNKLNIINVLLFLLSAYDYSIAPMDKAVVKTDIQIAVPAGCYGRVGTHF